MGLAYDSDADAASGLLDGSPVGSPVPGIL